MMLKNALLSYLLRQAQLANYQQLDEIVQEFGMTPSQYMVLGIVREHRTGVSSAALAKRLGVAPQSSYEIVAGLERQGLIRRTEDLGARRVLRVCLTAKGSALLVKCDRDVARFEGRFFAGLSADETNVLRELLTRVIRDSREKAASDSLAVASAR
jgi:DNA-binding MarR family transcriptional regulator